VIEGTTLVCKSTRIIFTLAAVLAIGLPCGPAAGQDTSGRHPEAASFLDHVEIGGIVELSATYELPYEGASSTSTAAEQLELGIGLELHSWLGTEIVWIHEHEDEEPEEDEGHGIGVFTGTIVFGPPGGWWWLKGGVQFLPFTMFELGEVHAVHDGGIGPFEMGSIVEPLSFEYGVKREKSLMLGVTRDRIVGTVYGYHGADARSSDSRSGFGAAVGYKQELENDGEFSFNLSFIDDLGAVESFQESVFEHDGPQSDATHGPTAGDEDSSTGWAAATQLEYDEISVVGEFMIAGDRFGPDVLEHDGRGARPSAWTLEFGYGFELVGRTGGIVLGYQGTSEAAALGLPVSRYVGVLSIDLWKEILVGTFEWVHDKDYREIYGGTGATSESFTVQLGLEF